MKILYLHTGPIKTNTYIVFENDKAVVIDPGADADNIFSLLKENNLTCENVLLTHGHWDHIGAVKQLQENGAKVYIHKDELSFLKSQFTKANSLPFDPDILLEDEMNLSLCSIDFKVLHTPGHTEGSVCYIAENSIFSGDTLFYLSVGRTDLPGGNGDKLISSIHNKLFKLEDNYDVYPGHSKPTTLDFEKKNNPYV